ncbi:MAG: hypothetical protein QOE61_1835, partial [Micromonosporaceae bacterium]|nr:hypothetical protein [Micromonosporaceae bacterium]
RFEATIARSGKAEWIAHCAAVKASNGAANPAEQVSRWQAFLVTEAPDDQRLVALNHLAGLGVWPLPDLERLHERGFLADGFYDTVHAQALAASGRTADALALLRRGSSTSMVTAEFYARKLAEQGRTDDSVRVCDESAMRFGDARLELLALDVLTQAGRTDTAVARATELLSRDDLPANLRHRVRNRLIDVHGARCDWLRAEKLARAGLTETQRLLQSRTSATNESPETFTPALADLRTWQQGYSWVIITCQLHRNQIDEAFRTLEQLDPPADTPGQIAAWGDLHRIHGWTPATAERALSLATRHDVPLFVAAPILSSLMQTCQASPDDRTATDTSLLAVTVSEELHQRLTDAWAALNSRFPAVARTLEGDGLDFAEQVRDLLLPHSINYDQALEAVRAGRLPLGALSAAARKPYLLSLARNAAGMITAVSAAPEGHEREVDTARDTLGSTIVIEGSALYLAASVTGLWPTVRDAFVKVLIPERTARDVILAHQAVRESANTVGYLNVDPDSGNPYFAPLNDATRMPELEATDKALRASQECRPAIVEHTGVFGVALNTDTIGPWLAPVAAAIDNDVALYSDDAYIRRLASYFGVRTFGSLALVKVLLETERIEAEATETIIENFFRRNVVDLPNVWPLVARTAQTDGASAQPILTNLARPSFWQDIGDDNFVGFLATLAQHLERQPYAVEAFTGATALGLTATFGPPERVLAILGTVVILAATDLTANSAEPALQAIRQVAACRGWDVIPLLREDLIAALADPEDSFAMSAEEAVETADRILGATQQPPQ